MICQPLVLTEKILLPILHIKLGLEKQFIKALKTDSKALSDVRLIFPKLSEAKMKGNIFKKPDLDNAWLQEMEDKVTASETWQSFHIVVHGFIRRNEAQYEDSVETLMQK